jgi:hypothetical protein
MMTGLGPGLIKSGVGMIGINNYDIMIIISPSPLCELWSEKEERWEERDGRKDESLRKGFPVRIVRLED